MGTEGAQPTREEDEEEVRGQDTEHSYLSAEDELVRVEVRRMSGAPLVSPWLSRSSSVQSLLEAAALAVGADTPATDAWLVLDNAVVDRRAASLKHAGISHDSVLTFVQRQPLWHQPHLGPNAILTELTTGGVTVKRRAGYSGAVVIARYPAMQFRVRVIDNSGDWSGAMELGFTATHPDDLMGNVPPVVGQLPKHWVMHNAGSLEVDNVQIQGSVQSHNNWHEALKPDDTLSVAIVCARENGRVFSHTASKTEFVVEVNGVVMVKAAIDDVEPSLSLYPVVGVYGKTTTVELLRD